MIMIRKSAIFLVLLSKAVFCFTIEEIDIKAGACASFIYFSNETTNEGYQRYSLLSPIDINIIFKLLDNISCETGMAYTCRTYYCEIDHVVLGPDHAYKKVGTLPFEQRHRYLSVYLLPEYSLGFLNSKGSRLYVNAGPSLDFYINTFERNLDKPARVYRSGNTNVFVIGFSQSLGYKLKIGNIYIGVENQYVESISNVYKTGSKFNNDMHVNISVKGIVGFEL